MLYYQRVLYILKIIKTKHISLYRNNLLVSYFKVKKTLKVIAKNY